MSDGAIHRANYSEAYIACFTLEGVELAGENQLGLYQEVYNQKKLSDGSGPPGLSLVRGSAGDARGGPQELPQQWKPPVKICPTGFASSRLARV